MNLRPSGYEPDELPGCSIPRSLVSTSFEDGGKLGRFRGPAARFILAGFPATIRSAYRAMPLPVQSPAPLSLSLGQEAAQRHRATKSGKSPCPMRDPQIKRRQKHPVYDFLHTYYSYSLWAASKGGTPGLGSPSKIAPERSTSLKDTILRENGIRLDRSRKNSHAQGPSNDLRRIHQLLTAHPVPPPQPFLPRAPRMGHGLLRVRRIRHRESAPLRLPQSRRSTQARFYSRPTLLLPFRCLPLFRSRCRDSLNRLTLLPSLSARKITNSRAVSTPIWTFTSGPTKAAPWISSDLLRETLFFAIEARDDRHARLTLRPLRTSATSPIPIETYGRPTRV